MNGDHWREENIYEEISQVDPPASTERLSNIYPLPPQKGHLHIVAWSSKLILTCWIIGEEIGHNFTVTVNNNQDVSDLQRAIMKEGDDVFGGIKAKNIMLWKVRISIVTILTLPTCKGFYTDEQ